MTQLKSFFDLVNELSMKTDKKLPNLKVPVKGKKGVSKFMRKKVVATAKDDLNAGFKTDANRKAAFAKMNDAVQSADKKPEKYLKPDGKVGVRMVKVDKEVIKKESIGKTAGDKSYYHLQRAKELAKKDGHDYDKLPKYDRAKPHQDHYHDKAKNEQMQVYRVGHKDMSGNVHATTPEDAMKKLRKKGLKGDIKLTHRGSARSMPTRRIPRREELDSKDKPFVQKLIGKLRKGSNTHAKQADDLEKAMKTEAINHSDAHRDAQTHSDGSMSVKKIPSMIKKPTDKHLHLHMKSYHKEKDGQDFAKKHGYKVKNYVKTQSGTRMDIHKEMVDPMDLRGRPTKKDPYHGKTKFGLKHPLHPLNIQKKKEKEAKKAAVKKEEVDEALTLQQRMKRGRLMKRLKARIKIGRDRARRKMANKKTLEKRSMRQARNQLAKRLTRGIPKRELTFARKQEIEKRLDKPALKARIQRIAKRIFKDVRKKEVQRKKG